MPAIEVVLTPRQLREFASCTAVLQEIVCEIAELWPNSKQLWITCVHRRPEERIPNESGVHTVGPPFRAVDIRIRNLADTSAAAQEKADAIATAVNARWVYDPSRPKLQVVVSKLHGTGPHLHCQSHPRTRRRGYGDSQ